MGSGDGKYTIERALAPGEVASANELTRRWFTSRPELPAAASGLGLWPLLTALAAGAVGRTREELLAAAGVEPARGDAVAGALLEAAKAAPALGLAFGVWAGPRITLDPDWAASFPADAVGSLTGDAAADKAALDAWASSRTDGMVERMPLDLDRPVDLVLATALMVRTEWLTRFHDTTARFRTGPWAGLGTCRVLTNTVHDDVLRVSDEASVLTVPGRDDVDVLLAIGRDDIPPAQVMSTLIEAAGDRHWGRSAARDLPVGYRGPGVEVSEHRASVPQSGPEVQVKAVRFSVSAELDLLEDAAALGLERASTHSAEFDRLAAQRTHVGQAKQKCVATFSATGFEAAAVTTLAMVRAGAVTMKHKHVRASIEFDRPFAYIARHRPSGLVLVGGWVTEPEPA